MAGRIKEKPSTVVRKIEKPLVRLNALFNDIIDNISYNTFDTNTKREKELKKLSNEVDDIVFQEIQNLTSFTGDDISTFLVKLFNDYDNKSQATVGSIQDIFTSDNSGLYQFFNDRYKNTNLLYEDLNMICSQLYELQEAISTTRDAIVTSDDISQAVSRTLKFKNSNADDTIKQSYVGTIESLEKKYKLLSKLKNHIVPKTLQYGKYFVYTIPYSELFNSYYKNKQKDKKLTNALESVDVSFVTDFIKTNNITSAKTIVEQSFKSYIKDIKVYNDDYAIPVVEGVDLATLANSDTFMKQVDSAIKETEKSTKKKKQTNVFADGTVDPKMKEADFSGTKGCYIKLIDPRKIIPVKILDEVIGYYYIHDMVVETSKSPFTTSIKVNPTNTNSSEIENAFLSKITDKIVKAFDKSYLENNSKFKELILNALTYNDLYKKQIKFQFIPKDYITEFTVNEDEEGNGTSVLIPSLFYAKLYLALLIFKMVSIITKSNDTKVYYVKQSGLDQNITNKLQDVARSIKEKQANFTDLLNYNSMISKIGQNKEVFMPVGRSGERGIEFDILSGQDIQLNTDLMEMLRTGYISGTGVPSVIMNYINEADYAKTLVMANAKFVGRVVNQQLDFNTGTTELYKKVIKYSGDVPLDIIENFEFVLSPPKSLNNMNLTDLISNADQTIMFMIKALTGENSDQTDDSNALKDILYNKFSREILPMLPWNAADKIYDESKVELVKKKTVTKDANKTE